MIDRILLKAQSSEINSWELIVFYNELDIITSTWGLSLYCMRSVIPDSNIQCVILKLDRDQRRFICIQSFMNKYFLCEKHLSIISILMLILSLYVNFFQDIGLKVSLFPRIHSLDMQIQTNLLLKLEWVTNFFGSFWYREVGWIL